MFSVRFLTLLAICTLAPGGWAQRSTGGESSGGTGSSTGSGGTSGSGASSAFGAAPASPAPSGPSSSTGAPSNPAAYAQPGGSESSAGGFGVGVASGVPAPSAPAPGAEAPGGGAARVQESPTSFSISAGYGRAPDVFVSGEGRLAQPRFLTRVSASIGFDDNVFQTPTNAQATPEVVIQQQVTAGTPDQVVFVPVRDTRPQRIGVISPPPQQQQFRRVVIPGEAPQFEEIVIPGTPKPKRQASAVSRETFSFDMQITTRRTLFTVDFNAGADYFWNRPNKKAEYNGSLAIRYLHRFTPRLQMTASVDASYLSQPDPTLINTPIRVGNGNLLTVNAKSDLSYRWAPRFSTVSSVSFNSIMFDDKLRQFGDFRSFTLGTELRYLWSPRLTAVLEGRYQQISYPNAPAINATSYFALIGFDLSLTRRAGATVRIGEAIRRFDESGDAASAPYLEATLNYQLGRASVLSWSNRFGFEEPPTPTTEVLGFRSGVTVTHFFGPRLRGSLALNTIYRSTKDSAVETEFKELTLDSGLSLLYTLSRYWTFNMNYSHLTVFTDPVDTGFFRNRLFTGFDYSF